VPQAIPFGRSGQLNDEKLRALEATGNVLVIANPGTGKTLLLAHKYVRLVQQGIKPEEILCLTYTNKATDEMRWAIIRALRESGLQVDLSRINVNTFHSYALEAIGAQETMSNNLLRYIIYRYLVDNRVLNYGDDYLISTIVPKIEDSIRYLKSFGVLPSSIDLARIQTRLEEYGDVTKEEMAKYAEAFVGIFQRYETAKAGKGIDYADMLLRFIALRKKPHFKYALVDELQDASAIEAEMVLQSCDNFFVVGDKKQAIFAFQGGSILNFSKFENSSKPILSENFRSTNEILDFAKSFFVAKTADQDAEVEMRDLKNNTKGPGPKPKIYGVPDEAVIPTACELVRNIRNRNKKVAVIARTNSQIRTISQELTRRGIEHSSTYFQASDDAHAHVIRFLLGVFSNKPEDIRNAMFSPFFPISLQDAFTLSQLEDDEFREQLPLKCPQFHEMRTHVRRLPDVDALFRSQVIPVAIAYGREYMLAALDLQKAFAESINVLGEIDLDAVVTYLRSADLATDESQKEGDVVVTTVHKAKGRQFEAVVYLPKDIAGRENFQDEVVKRILETHGISVEEELAEEPLRIDFVALTRAKDELHIVTEDAQGFLNDYSEPAEIQQGGVQWTDASERLKRAFALFVDGQDAKAKELLKNKTGWIRDFIKDWFANLDHVSFSSLPRLSRTPKGTERAAQDYLISHILGIQEPSTSLELGSQIHQIARALVMGEEYAIPEELGPFVSNIRALVDQIKRDYPEVVAAEQPILLPLESLIGEGEGVNFQGIIDAIFRKSEGEYLLVDWKTDKNKDRESSHRQQLQAYRCAFSASAGVPIAQVKVAVGYVGLRGRVNLNQTRALLDMKQPREDDFETFKNRVKKVLLWRQTPESFLEELGKKSNDLICRAVQEEYEIEG
jgi:DNA helicase-2/ATP-dependent DNA helicase PcrA